MLFFCTIDIWASLQQNLLGGFANNKGADQPAHTRSLINAFVILLQESIICILASSKVSMFQLVSVAEETGLNLALSETPKTGFVVTRPILMTLTLCGQETSKQVL